MPKFLVSGSCRIVYVTEVGIVNFDIRHPDLLNGKPARSCYQDIANYVITSLHEQHT